MSERHVNVDQILLLHCLYCGLNCIVPKGTLHQRDDIFLENRNNRQFLFGILEFLDKLLDDTKPIRVQTQLKEFLANGFKDVLELRLFYDRYYLLKNMSSVIFKSHLDKMISDALFDQLCLFRLYGDHADNCLHGVRASFVE